MRAASACLPLMMFCFEGESACTFCVLTYFLMRAAFMSAS